MKFYIPEIVQDTLAFVAGASVENKVGDGNSIEGAMIGGAFVGGLGLFKDLINRKPVELAKDVAAFSVGVGVECYLSGGAPNLVEAVKTGAATLGAWKAFQHANAIKPAAPSASAPDETLAADNAGGALRM